MLVILRIASSRMGGEGDLSYEGGCGFEVQPSLSLKIATFALSQG